MFRSMLPLACLAGFAATVHAQDKPTAEQVTAVSATWKFDQSQSDTVTPGSLGFRADVGVGSQGAGAGGGGKRGRRASSAPTSNAPTSQDSADAQRAGNYASTALRDPHMAMIFNDMNPGAQMVLSATDTTVTITNTGGQATSFKTDGRKHQQAQMDGSIIETQALWKDGTLEIDRGVVGTATLKREFKPGKDGTTLELKETADAGGAKVQKKLVFTRG